MFAVRVGLGWAAVLLSIGCGSQAGAPGVPRGALGGGGGGAGGTSAVGGAGLGIAGVAGAAGSGGVGGAGVAGTLAGAAGPPGAAGLAGVGAGGAGTSGMVGGAGGVGVCVPPPNPGAGGTAASNPRPKVIPSVKEWTAGNGSYATSRCTRLCIDPRHAAALRDGAAAFKADLLSAVGLELPIVETGQPNPSDILVTLDGADPQLGDEGYLLQVSDRVTLRANTARGAFYGTRTLLQLFLQAPGKDQAPQGTIKDYPTFPVRGFMIDVGRMPITMAWLRAYVKFMSYYKMGDLHIHLNDNAIIKPPKKELAPQDNPYVAFRLESTTYPGLQAKDLVYTKQEYAELHALAKTYGVTIISEFDTPAHSGAFTLYRPDLKHPALDWDHLNLGNRALYPFMDALWDEYAGIFHQVHIGTDEYNGGDPMDMKNYMNHYNRYLKAKGFGPIRMWGSQGTIGGAGGVDRDMLVHIWYNGYYHVNDAIRDGYDVINTADGWYTVPEAGYYSDRLDPKKVYDEYEVWKFTAKGDVAIDKHHPQLKGATFCVWNDVWHKKKYTEMAVHDRVRAPMKVFSQKMWNNGTELTYPEFSGLMQTLGEGPGVF